MRIIVLNNLLIIFSISSFQIYPQSKSFRWRDKVKQLRRVDLLPLYRNNQYIDQESSCNRTWGNDDGFSGQYSYIRKENGHLVIAEFEGPGVVN